MKKDQFLIFLLGLCLGLGGSQRAAAQADCRYVYAQTSFRVQDLEVKLPGLGGLWWDKENPGYLIDDPERAGRQVAALFAGGLWIGGLDPAGNLRLAASAYGASAGHLDYWPGPLSIDGQTARETCTNYDRFWTVTRSDIDALLDDFNDSGSVDGAIPTALRDWPALGNPYFEELNGFDLPSPAFHHQDLAPFYDQDGDGRYDPARGDYPLIKGADRAIWWIFNDAANFHSESEGAAIGAEIHAMAYTYDQAAAPINRTTFYDYTIIHRGTETIDSSYVGIWVDPDLGCLNDDYVGCYPEKNLFYAYNGDALDDDDACGTACEETEGFCEDIPVVGIKLLKGTTGIDPDGNDPVDNGLSSLTYFYKTPHPVYSMRGPSEADEYYNYLTGTWRDGTLLVPGGTGYNPVSPLPTKYAFPDNPSDPDGWSMCAEELDPYDLRAVLGSGPFQLRPGAVQRISFAVYLRDAVVHPCPDLSDFFADGDLIEAFYQGVPTGTRTGHLTAGSVQLHPHPLRDYSLLSLSEGRLRSVALFSSSGQLLRSYPDVHDRQLRIERGDLPGGMYFYRLQNEWGQWTSGKLLLQ